MVSLHFQKEPIHIKTNFIPLLLFNKLKNLNNFVFKFNPPVLMGHMFTMVKKKRNLFVHIYSFVKFYVYLQKLSALAFVERHIF